MISYDLEIPHPERESIKRFRKQPVNYANASEILDLGNDLLPAVGTMHNELYQTTTVWFRPAIDPRHYDIKMPEKAIYGGVSYNMFACFEYGVSSVQIAPHDHMHIGTGVTLHTGLQVKQTGSGFEHSPNWYGQFVGTKDLEKNGIITGTAIIDPHDEDEIGVTLFNMSNTPFIMGRCHPIGQLVFNSCHSPDLGSELHSMVHRFDRKYIIISFSFFVCVLSIIKASNVNENISICVFSEMRIRSGKPALRGRRYDDDTPPPSSPVPNASISG